MFFVDFRYKKLPKKIKEKVNDLHFLDREIYEANKRNQKINLLVINYTIFSIKVFLEFKKELSSKTKYYLEEALGEIPFMFFYIDNLKIDKRIKKYISLLIDLADFGTLKNHEKEKLIKKVFNNLKKLQNYYKKERFFFNFKLNQVFNIRIINPILMKEMKNIKNEYNLENKTNEINKISVNIFVKIINLYQKYKEKSLINLLENLSFFFYYRKKYLNNRLWNIIKKFIDIKEYNNINNFLNTKIHQFEKLKI